MNIEELKRVLEREPLCHADYVGQRENLLAPMPTEHASSVIRLASRMEEFGFCILEHAGGEMTSDVLIDVATRFGLGRPFVPPVYGTNNPHFDPTGVNAITNSIELSASHRGFSSSKSQ